jgi:hypothetical protein
VPRCLAAQCPEGFTCSEGECTDPCLELMCPAGEICNAGRCVGDSCYLTGCADGLRCEQGECIDDQCVNERCPTGRFCRQTAGEAQCINSCATVSCGYSEICTDGLCVPDPCAGVDCPNGIACIRGACDADCSGIICPRGQTCTSGQCGHDPCFNVTCPMGQRCQVVEGTSQCVADWLMDETPEFSDAATPTEPTDMGTSMIDSDFVPSSYDQGIQPPSFEWDAGDAPPLVKDESNGCDCTQPKGTPPYLWMAVCMLPMLTRRRRHAK